MYCVKFARGSSYSDAKAFLLSIMISYMKCRGYAYQPGGHHQIPLPLHSVLDVPPHALCRLQDIAAAAQESPCPAQLLHRRLLEQLDTVEEVTQMSPDELVAELRDLQLAVLYGGGPEEGEEKEGMQQPGGPVGSDGAGAEPLAARAHNKDKGTMDKQLEEFLLQQVCGSRGRGSGGW